MKAVLITGASSGIGEAFTRKCAKEGHNLVIIARSKDKLERLKQELIKDYGIKIHIIIKDLAEPNASDEIYSETSKENIQVEMLINNAGFATKGFYTKDNLVKMQDEINVNMLAVTKLIYLYVKEMEKTNNGVVINVASAAAFNPLPYSAVYAATKAYVLSLTQSLYYEYRNSGIQFIAICPGATDTHFFDNITKMSGKMRLPEDVVNTTWKGLAKKKIVVADGSLAKIQSVMPRLFSRKHRLVLTGKVGDKIWGDE